VTVPAVQAAAAAGVPHRSPDRRLDGPSEHLPVQLGQLRGGVQPELVGQPGPVVVVRLQGAGHVPARVERPHQQPDRPFPQRCLGDQRPQLGDPLLEPPLVEERRGPLLADRQPHLLQAARLGHGEVPVEPRPRRTAPQRERPVEGRDVASAASRRGELEEPVGVHHHPVPLQRVAGAAADEQPGRRSQRPPRAVHGGVQRGPGVLRRGVVPDQVDQPVGGHDPAPGEDERREQPARSAGGERPTPTVHGQHRRSEDQDLHPGRWAGLHRVSMPQASPT
jgi:hypothetical protein